MRQDHMDQIVHDMDTKLDALREAYEEFLALRDAREAFLRTAEQLRQRPSEAFLSEEGNGNGHHIEAPEAKPAPKAKAKPEPAAEQPKRARRGRPPGTGHRDREILQILSDGKPWTVAEIAKSMGIKPNYLYRRMSLMKNQGKVVRDAEGRWSLA